MMCLKHLMIYSILLPVPAASPLFLAFFVAAVFWRERPCSYCLVLYAILFLATSPSSPFVDSYPSVEPSTLSASTPMPNRTWLSANSGHLLDPALAGYQPSFTDNDTVLAISDQANGAKVDQLPPHHVDWRWKGIGMVVDFGWKRTDEGIRWERAPTVSERLETEPEDLATRRGSFWGGIVQNVLQGSARWTEL